MLTYDKIRKNRGKIINVEKGSRDAWFLGEAMRALGFDKEKSNFTFTQKGTDVGIDSGKIILDDFGTTFVIK